MRLNRRTLLMGLAGGGALAASPALFAPIGPVSAFEALAISDYVKNAGVPMITSVNQFWTYPQDSFLKKPVYSRDFPVANNIEG